MWGIEVTDEFLEWYGALDETDLEGVNLAVDRLSEVGPLLARPYADTVYGSRHSNLKELRIQSRGKPLRVFFAFDPRRVGLLLVGGDKTGDRQFYERMIPMADDLYDEHLSEIEHDDA